MISTTEKAGGPGLWRAREAAEFLAISERHLWTLTRRGVIPCVKLGTSIRYDPADLRALIEAQKKVPESTCTPAK